MARRRVVVAGAGAMGASIAYHLALLGAESVVLCDTGEVASGATARAMGGKSISIDFDEGQDAGPDNFGLAVLDNVDVNGTLVGQGPTEAN